MTLGKASFTASSPKAYRGLGKRQLAGVRVRVCVCVCVCVCVACLGLQELGWGVLAGVES